MVMVLSLVTTVYAAGADSPMVITTVDKTAVKPGETITVTYTLDHDLDKMTRLDIALRFDASLVQFEGTDFEGSVWYDNPTQNEAIVSGDENFVRIKQNKNRNTATIAAGKICSITFKALEEISTAQSALFYNNNSGLTKSGIRVNAKYYYVDGTGFASGVDDPITVNIMPDGSSITVPKVETGYSVSMGADQQVAAGQQVRIPVTVASSEKKITGFNAYDMTFTYDPTALTLNTKTGDAANLTVEDNNGTVRVRRYGATQALGEALALDFTAIKAASSAVTLTSAKFDIDANSINFDAPDATITDADTTVKALWNVSLPDGFLSTAANGSTLVENGGDFTFKTTDTHYEYYLNITTNGATNIVKMDNATYTIKNVTDNVTVTVDNKIGKTYTIKFVAVDSTTTVEEDKATVDDLVAYSTTTVQYPNDYQFTVKFPGTGYVVWVDIEPYKNNKSYVRQEDGAKLYTLSGASLAGDDNNEITITLTKAKNTSMHKIEVTDSGADAFSESNAKTFYTGENYTFTLNKNDTYYDYSMRVYYERPKSSYGTERIYMEYKDNGDGTYTIIDMPNYDVTIRITKTAKAIDPDAVEVLKYLELDNKTVFMVRVRGALSAYNADGTIRMIGFTYDGQRMYVPSCYKPGTGESYSVYLVILNKGETLTKEEATEKLGVVTSTSQEYRDHYVEVGSDVNEDGIGGVGIDRRDVNDVQLIYDLYNGLHDSFETVSMRKFLKADVNGDCSLDSKDAVRLAGQVIAG